MKGEEKTREQLKEELAEQRQRVDDLEASEAEGKQAEETLKEAQTDKLTQVASHQAALLDIGRATQAIEHIDDLERVVRVMFEQMKAIGLDFSGLDFQRLIDAETQTFEVHGIWPDMTYHKDTELRPNALVEWQTHRVLYRRDLSMPEYREGLGEDYRGAYLNLGIQVRCILHVPNTYGLLTLRSETPNAFSDADVDIIRNLTEMLGLGISRVEDLERLEKRNAELVRSNVDLKEEIAERKRAEASLQKEKAVAQGYLDIAGVMMVALNAKGEIILCNKKGCDILGYETSEIIGRNWFSTCLPSNIVDEVQGVFTQLMAGQVEPVEFYENPVVTGGGEHRIISFHNTVLRDEFSKITGVLFSGEDITERKQAEEALRESEKSLATAASMVYVGPWEYDVLNDTFTFNDLFYAIYNTTAKEAGGYRMSSSEYARRFVYPEDRHLVGEEVRRAIESDDPSLHRHIEHRVLYPNGEVGYIVVRFDIVKDDKGRTIRTYGVNQNITERKQAEEALRESGELHRTVLQTAMDGFWLVDMQGCLLEVNDAYCQMSGYSAQELLAMRISDLETNEPAADTAVNIQKIVAQGKERFESRHRRKDGDVFDVEVSTHLLANVGLIVCFLRDITGHKKMEQELIRLERLRALGEMSGGVSHNLNNILTSVLGPAQILLMSTDDPNVREDAERIILATRRARDLVHRLYLSTRGVAEDELQPVQVNKVIGEAVQATRPRWKDESESRGIAVEVVTELDEGSPSIKCTESRFHDIFVNLIFNAVDAMPEGGTVTIRNQIVEKGVQITVTDTGIGMDEKTRRRVFEPFFTTKMDVGSGLGLSTAYGAVTTWGGHIEVESEPGRGTTFTMWVPAWEGDGATAEKAVDAPQARHARLLIVEDDEDVCDLLCRLLGHDHEVEAVSNGRDALDRFAPGKYAVALIDQGMPGIPGDQVAREMHRADPLLATVLITGWEFSKDDPRLSVYDLRIQKPFDDIEEVKNVVTQVVALHDRRVEGQV